VAKLPIPNKKKPLTVKKFVSLGPILRIFEP